MKLLRRKCSFFDHDKLLGNYFSWMFHSTGAIKNWFQENYLALLVQRAQKPAHYCLDVGPPHVVDFVWSFFYQNLKTKKKFYKLFEFNFHNLPEMCVWLLPLGSTGAGLFALVVLFFGSCFVSWCACSPVIIQN